MARRRKQSGFTLIEILVGGLIMTLLGVGLFTLVRSTYDSQYEILGQNGANTNARQAVDEFADKMRGAKALSAATASELTFTDANNAANRYWVSGGNLCKTVNGAPTGGSVVVKSVQSVSCVYWTNSGGSWTSS